MPGGDRTGPMGMGPMTGRGAGLCAGSGAPGFMNRFVRGGSFGRGRGGGGGGGRGWRNMFYATGLTGWQRAEAGVAPVLPQTPPAVDPQQELQSLAAQADAAAATLEQVRRRIDEITAARAQSSESGKGGAE